MILEDLLNQARRDWPLAPDDAINAICDAIAVAAGGRPSIMNCRKTIADAFKEDPAWRQTYVDNAACVIMDFFQQLTAEPGSEIIPLSHELRDQLAEKLIAHLFET